MMPITRGSLNVTLLPFRFRENSLEKRGKVVDKFFIYFQQLG
jgi:hypothetical protein